MSRDPAKRTAHVCPKGGFASPERPAAPGAATMPRRPPGSLRRWVFCASCSAGSIVRTTAAFLTTSVPICCATSASSPTARSTRAMSVSGAGARASASV